MQTHDPDEDIRLYRLTSVRTCGINGDPDRVVLAVSAGDEEWFFVLHLDDLAALGRRVTQDAVLLKG